MSPSRRDFVRTAGIAAATAAVGSTVGCNGSSSEPTSAEATAAGPPLEPDTKKKIKIAMLNGHWPEGSSTHMFPGGDTEHQDFLTKFFNNSDNIDELLEDKVMISDPGQRGALRGLGARIPADISLEIYDIINADVDELRLNCSGESHWY